VAAIVESSERTVSGAAFPAAGTWALDPAPAALGPGRLPEVAEAYCGYRSDATTHDPDAR